MNPTNVTPLHREGEPPMTAAEQRLYWRAYNAGWRDCLDDGSESTYEAGFLAGIQVQLDAISAPSQRHLRVVS